MRFLSFNGHKEGNHVPCVSEKERGISIIHSSDRTRCWTSPKTNYEQASSWSYQSKSRIHPIGLQIGSKRRTPLLQHSACLRTEAESYPTVYTAERLQEKAWHRGYAPFGPPSIQSISILTPEHTTTIVHQPPWESC